MGEYMITTAEREHVTSEVEAMCRASGRLVHMHIDDLTQAYEQARARGESHQDALIFIRRLSTETVANL